MLKYTYVLVVAFLNADMEDLKSSVKDFGSAEANDLELGPLTSGVNDCGNQNTILMRFFLYRNRLQY